MAWCLPIKRRREEFKEPEARFCVSETESTEECPLHSSKYRKWRITNSGPSYNTCSLFIIMIFPLLLTMSSTTPHPHTHSYVYLGTFLPSNNCCPCVCTCVCWMARHSAEQKERLLQRRLLSTKGLPRPLSSGGNLTLQMDHWSLFGHQAVRWPGSSALLSRNDKDPLNNKILSQGVRMWAMQK